MFTDGIKSPDDLKNLLAAGIRVKTVTVLY
jgi:hypothetical protein